MSVGFKVLGMVPDVDLSGSRVQGVYGSFPKIREPQYKPQNTMIFIMGTPTRSPYFWETPI